MVQKIIWMLPLLFGILSSFQACEKGNVDKVFYEEFNFTNKSIYELEIKSFSRVNEELYCNTYTIAVDSTLTQEVEIMFGSVTGIIACSDSVVVVYEDEKEISYLPCYESSYNILNRNNFIVSNTENNHVVYSYTFTNKDFDHN